MAISSWQLDMAGPARQTLSWPRARGFWASARRYHRLSLLRGVVLVGLAVPAWAQYAGPAILSRGEAPAAMTAPSVDFVFSLQLSANYTNGLVGLESANSQGV